MPTSINKIWHEKHQLPMPSTLEQRVRWHEAHLKHCRCRKDVPPTIAKELKKEGKKVCSRGHLYKIADAPCRTCWPGSDRARASDIVLLEKLEVPREKY